MPSADGAPARDPPVAPARDPEEVSAPCADGAPARRPSVKLPGGYHGFTFPGGYGFVHASSVEHVRRALGGGTTLHEWAARQDGAEPLRGRGVVCSVPAPCPGPDGRDRWAVRRYRRGGAVAFLGERYLRIGTPRPVLELRASLEARARGVPTPAIVAGVLYRVGLFHRADIASELVPRTRSLAAWMFGSDASAADRRTSGTAAEALRLAGGLTRALEDAGVLHADLNAHNVLIGVHEGLHTAHVVDLDRCRVLALGAPRRHGPMRRRLERSLRKLAREHGAPLSDAHWEALETGFGNA